MSQANLNNFIIKIIDRDIASGLHKSVRTRFPPEPNGYLHIGHAKSICLNFGIAEHYQGQCYLRFDDTNPVKEHTEFIESMKNDILWLGFHWSGEIHYSSDYFDQLYSYAIELIHKGLAYVDHLSVNQIRDYRGTLTKPGKNSPYRDRSIDTNIALFDKMRRGEFKEGSTCLRAKIDMTSPFIVMRDPVLYRIKYVDHHRTGNKWCIYPMYDFAHSICDAIEGITHSLCTLEFQDNRRLYDWVLNNISLNVYPHQYEFSRLNIEHTIISKRKLHLLVSKNVVTGWDDPRMPTIAGLRRRGYTAASILEFCRRIGITKQDNNVEISALEACIREDLNESAPRVMAVINPIKVIINNYPVGYKENIMMPNHPNKPEFGQRKVTFSREIYIDCTDFRENNCNQQYKRLILGQQVRLRYAYVIEAERVEKNEQGNITIIHCSYYKNSLNQTLDDSYKVKGVIHWVSAIDYIAAEFRFYDKLFSDHNLASTDDFNVSLNHRSLIIYHGVIETSFLPLLKSGKINYFQFEREGYFCTDSKDCSKLQPVFNRIVGLRNNWLAKS
ncbi:glutamine--tRNA ligase [Candidatus Palibaumannia cicadellinicola]|uniref:Glutamine--tRNA ligase n=1 Tax=Baumannia cicadellinicola subsp. Homalodisca coagulata TaxID=374463 RepID=Q1LTZ7_BAUCH|nr:glutaminyl-tRNA synthetase [Baumannia cicadellinicola str. Hc (Homalodisca coagulata)]